MIQASQQGHAQIVNLLLEHNASPNVTTIHGQTALSIAQRLGYISVVETLKVVTETIVTTTTTTITEEKYKLVTPEVMHESFMSDSEDEGGRFFSFPCTCLVTINHNVIYNDELAIFAHSRKGQHFFWFIG